LATKVHQGNRPSLSELSSEISPGIISMMTESWSVNRNDRKTAAECLSILTYHHSILSGGYFDIFFSHTWSQKPFLSNIYNYLTKKGFRVWYDQYDMGHNMVKSMSDGVQNSSVILVCASEAYQNSNYCMFELKESYTLKKPILTIVIQENPLSWASEKYCELCTLKSNQYIDISKYSTEINWNINDNESNNNDLLLEFNLHLENISTKAIEMGAKQSLKI
jgi:hypothetical protein